MKKLSTNQITTIGLLFAITIILGATGLGFFPIPPFKTTIMHVPVIIGSIIEGPIVGGIIGLLFGIFSMIQAINTPTPVSFIFMNPIVAILPRVLIGITSYYVYKAVKTKVKAVNIGAGAFAGSFTNTLGVLGIIYFFFLGAFASAMHITHIGATLIILGYVLNGFISAAAAIIITVPVVLAVTKTRKV